MRCTGARIFLRTQENGYLTLRTEGSSFVPKRTAISPYGLSEVADLSDVDRRILELSPQVETSRRVLLASPQSGGRRCSTTMSCSRLREGLVDNTATDPVRQWRRRRLAS
jgi:hypothetical protein